jgi:hypothetical protein
VCLTGLLEAGMLPVELKSYVCSRDVMCVVGM